MPDFPMTLEFDGKRYKYFSTHNTKASADAKAKSIRKTKNARIVKRRQPANSRMKWAYNVYCSTRR